MTLRSHDQSKFHVIVAGGGVAAMEAVVALHDLAPDRLDVTLLTSTTTFAVRALAVREPFAFAGAQHHPIAPIADDLGARIVAEDLASVDRDRKTLRTSGGTELAFDALIVACGARPSVRYQHAITVDDRKLDDLLHGTIQDIEGDYVHSLAFVAPTRMAWPLPLYELALMTAHRAWDMGVELKTTIVTPENGPLGIFGDVASEGVEALLAEREIELITSGHVEIPGRREVKIEPGRRTLSVNRVIALPELFGPALPGLPSDEYGFLPIDDHCRVDRVAGVYAAGDATNFPVKHGGLSTQMADTAARSIASLAGAPVTATPLDPILRGMLLTGRAPKYLYAHLVGGLSRDSEFTDTPSWDPPSKISSHYLAPYLEARDSSAVPVR